MDLRKRGKRKDPETIASKKQRGRLGDPLNAIDAGSPGEIRISSDTMIAISHLYNSSPSIQAARAILLGQLLGSGVVVRRQGRDVNLKPVFARHLEDVWVPFARQVIDHFLMFGFVLVSLEKESPPPFANFVKGKQLASTSNMAPRGKQGATKEAPTPSEVRAKAAPPITDDARLDRRINDTKVAGGGNLVPTVPDLGQYEVSFVHVGESNYQREYRVFSTNSDSVYRQDFSSELFFKSQPDAAGNICSPVSTVFQSASFISSLEELALQAEVVRARQLLVTQPAMRNQGSQNLDPSNLFFDSESRAVQASSASDEDTAQAQNLATTAKLMQMINRMQTTDQAGRERPAASGGVTHVPPPMPPQLFTWCVLRLKPTHATLSHNSYSTTVRSASKWCRACARPRLVRTWSTSCAWSTITVSTLLLKHSQSTRALTSTLCVLAVAAALGVNAVAFKHHPEFMHSLIIFCLAGSRQRDFRGCG
jgi:hypothetical protein